MFWRVLLIAFSSAYLLALFAWGAGTLGWLGTPRDPLSAVWLVILGLPWVHWVDVLPETAWPWAAALSPLPNVFVFYIIEKVTRRRRLRAER